MDWEVVMMKVNVKMMGSWEKYHVVVVVPLLCKKENINRKQQDPFT